MAENALVVIAAQNGWVMKPDTTTHVNRMDIRSATSNNLYTVSQTRRGGIWMCECLGYRRNRTFDAQGRRSCKHLKAILPVIETRLAPSPRRVGRS